MRGANRIFTVPLSQTPFTGVDFEHFKIDLSARTVSGFARYHDAAGNSLKSEAFSINFDSLGATTKTSACDFVCGVVAALQGSGTLPAGTDSVA